MKIELGKTVELYGLVSSSQEQQAVLDSCEHVHGTSGFIKCRKSLSYLRN
jgi:hypothetical protein